MRDDSIPSAVLARLHSLDALAADPGTTEHERALAADRAAALRARYPAPAPEASPGPSQPSAPVYAPGPVFVVHVQTPWNGVVSNSTSTAAGANFTAYFWR